MEYYQRLKDLREDKDLNQKAVAQLLNMTQQQYSLYEKGKREIPITCIMQLAKFYNVSIDYLLGTTNNPKHFRKD